MKTHRIALYPGDGIGIDVVDQTVRVLDRAAELDGGFTLRYARFDWGCEYYARHGVVAPEDYLDQLRPFDAIPGRAGLAAAACRSYHAGPSGADAAGV